ncbi:DNA polymerase III, subunits gamma and tau [Denitrovibrio acetiphilus DSM 12809]|uniref:DNA polymerase III subunit gamma/tau n=1 Tax=Denitrovibrio acetiphilus (strain DSM 12809 / NBRC 114555 / N2460) TaxID=522772 RepID=D4H1F3_DENA2|nr:DNA polymerase III subunit gamma/tau [Denitrovibrio acetiphilus]ADD66901.1 DNA polymerase III, subunits gamma and tau [Denitrovibrio acetiphilus DSM 12809]
MSYIALARKLRPQNFDELSGQEFVVTTLKNSIEMGRVAHAYLFTGPRGVGKTSAARILAKAVNCLEPVGSNPCNKCENCTEITSGTSMDVVEIDGASNRGIDEIRELREAVRFLPVKCKFKVYIIDEVHMLTEHAFNALLKTLEEPPDYVMFILATTDPQRLPATIISRCQKYDFNKIPFEIMYDSLAGAMDTEGIEYDKDALNLVVRNSDGCMRDSLSLLDQIIAFTGGKLDEQSTSFLLGFSEKSLVDKLFALIIKEQPEEIPDAIEELSGKGVNFAFATETLIGHTRNLLMQLITKKENKELTSKENDYYKELVKNTSEQQLYALFQVFQKLLNDLKFFSFEQYIFEFGMYKAANIGSVISSKGLASQTSSDTTGRAATVKKPVAETSSKPTLSSTDLEMQNIISAVEQEIPGSLSSMLGHGYIVHIADKVLTIGFSSEKKFYFDFVNRAQNMQALNRIIPAAFNSIDQVKTVIEQDTKKKSIVEKKQTIETFHEKKIRQEAKEDGLVQKIIREFDGKLEDIEVLQKPSFE